MTDSSLMNNAVVSMNNSQTISIVAENGETFNPGQKIIYNIEPEIGYIKQDSYLVLDIVNNSADNSRYTLQKNIGAHGVIERVDIFSKETGVLLESNTNYAQWCNIENQYLLDSVQNIQNEEGVGKPVQSFNNFLDAANTETSSKCLASAIYIENNQLSPIDNGPARDGANGGRAAYTTRRFCIPLRCGVFRAYDNDEKAIPIMNFGGLRIEITLATAQKALQRVAGNYKTIEVSENGLDHNASVDWVVGRQNAADATNQTTAADNKCEVKIELAGSRGWRTEAITDCGLVVGNKMNFTGNITAGGAFTYDGVIETITVGNARNIIIDGKTKAFGGTLIVKLEGGAGSPNGLQAGGVLKVSGTPSYKIMSTEFRLCQVVPDAGVADSMMSGVNYEYTGYEVFFNNIPTASLRHQIPINSVASKALAVFTSLYSAEDPEGVNSSAADIYAGITPTSAHLNDVVYFINNRLYPLRSYSPQAKKDKVLTTNELVKAFRAINKQPMNLGDADFDNLQGYTNTPLICRELARAGMVFDLRNAEPELRLGFTAARANILRADTFVFSKKIIQTTATGVQVIH